ncbi:Site-specific recombinase XerD [Sphingomonas palmae]|uniref:Site-specific recombinase XerD n=1 Tax=Sphingomonas palmae TaxID=1855283 RepID=A0A1H7T883_9SPHN|nr:site-specific integrase [Sphingomonas palmae]SEL80564.1 Site-specific recombinase XerD [Sphingomonas palmae]
MKIDVAQLRPMTKMSREEKAVLDGLGPLAADPGLHYLVYSESQEIIEPALLYLYATYGHDGRPPVDEEDAPSLASNRAAAYELAEWLRFLLFVKRKWETADQQLFCVYASLLATRVSYQTGRSRKAGTISHKFSTIFGFYRWTNAARLTDVRWEPKQIRSGYKRAGRERKRLSDDEIRPFSPPELKKLLAELGPLPSQRPNGSTRPCRDRLLFQTGLLTGLRGEEICYLRARQILRLKPDLDRPNETQALLVTVTKGRKKRWVALPNSLIHELKLYIRGERADAVGKLVDKGGADHNRLFVNLADHAKAGSSITTKTIHRRTHALMVRLGFTEKDEKIVDGEKVACLRILHSFHDTRHTYAINLYLAQRSAGDPKPWETVSVMLGHDHWKTTEEYYLRSVGLFEPQIGVRLSNYLEDL